MAVGTASRKYFLPSCFNTYNSHSLHSTCGMSTFIPVNYCSHHVSLPSTPLAGQRIRVVVSPRGSAYTCSSQPVSSHRPMYCVQQIPSGTYGGGRMYRCRHKTVGCEISIVWTLVYTSRTETMLSILYLITTVNERACTCE